MRILIEGVNPEPWRAPKLSTRRIGKKVVPHAVKDENLRTYQLAVHELVHESLVERGFDIPVFPKGTTLYVQMQFWRSSEGIGRYQPHHADTSNMTKALEDALQGLVYDNDKSNVHVSGELMAFGPHVKPLIAIESYEVAYHGDTLPEWVRCLWMRPSTKTGCVWLEES